MDASSRGQTEDDDDEGNGGTEGDTGGSSVEPAYAPCFVGSDAECRQRKLRALLRRGRSDVPDRHGLSRDQAVPRDRLREQHGWRLRVPVLVARVSGSSLDLAAVPDDTKALARRESAAVTKSLRLALPVAEALERFRREVDLPILDEAQAKLPPSGVAYAELRPDGFVLRWPVRLRNRTGVGPRVVGTLVPTDTGCELALRLERFAPTPSQRTLIGGLGVVIGVGLLGLLVAGSYGLAAFALLVIAARLGFDLRRRRRAELDLLAHAQRVFGPIALPDRDRDPFRLPP
jgi:hypothetical protein